MNLSTDTRSFGRAVWASDPATSRGRLFVETPEPEPHGLRARPRPGHPLHRLSPAEGQDPGLSLRRGRPLPDPPDPHAGSRPDRPGARPRPASGRGPRRGAGARPRSRPSALRPCRRAGARRGDGRLWRLRPQCPEPAGGHRAGAALPDIRRAQPHLGDAGRAGQAQRSADRCLRATRSAATWSTACLSPFANTPQAGSVACQPRRAEAQAAAIADDIAYDAHDIDDGLRAGLLSRETLAEHAAGRRDPGRHRRGSSRSRRRSRRFRTDPAADHRHDRRRDRREPGGVSKSSTRSRPMPCAPPATRSLRSRAPWRPTIAPSRRR